MIDHNKVRDEVCDNPEFNIGDTKMDALLLHNRKFGWNECVKHLSKQSVEFDEVDSATEFSKTVKDHPKRNDYDQLDWLWVHTWWRMGASWQHQQTAAIYEAKLAILEQKLATVKTFFTIAVLEMKDTYKMEQITKGLNEALEKLESK